MRNILQSFVFWFFRNFLVFLAIVGILAAAVFLQKEINSLGALTTDLSRLEIEQRNLQEEFQNQKADVSDRVAQLKNVPAGVLGARIAYLAKEIEQKQIERQKLGGLPSLLIGNAVGSGIATRLKLDMEVELMKQERDYLAVLLSAISEPLELDALRRKHVTAYVQLMQNKEDQARLKTSHPFLVLVPSSIQFNQLRQLNEAHKQLEQKNLSAYEDYKRKEELVKRIKDSPQSFKIQEDQIDGILKPLNSAIDSRRKLIQDNWFSKLSQPVISVIPGAFLILLVIVVTPLLIKILFYFVLAPLASRRPPIRILPGALGSVMAGSGGMEISAGQPGFTSVSQKLTLAKNEVLLIHPEYLQSSPLESRIDTKWLLDWSLPLSSLVSGMVALIRIRSDENTMIVISPVRDALSEVGVLDLPEGSAMVFQPRSLVGVVYREEAPLRITRHWRLASLHAWLTLQLRYIVFHGPSKLIVKGCRGARIEAANNGRRINQAGTMGFSANLWYSTTRCETFASYLMGEQELLHDSFAGTSGFYVYEETPNFGRKTGLTGRGLQGVFDSLLKVFGL